MKYYIGIDLGGTNIVAGLVDENYQILKKVSRKTNNPVPRCAQVRYCLAAMPK